MATITQSDFNARMDAWWNARMAPSATTSRPRDYLRVAAWQQAVGRTDKSTHYMLFTEMYGMLQQAANQNPEEIARLVLSGMDYQAIANAVVAAMSASGRTTEETAAALKTALGDRAEEVGRILAA